jgi:transcriptional regulator with XRE-family HTH domain
MLRIRRGWRQDDVSGKSGLSPAAISRHELGRIGSLAAPEKHATVFSLRLDVRMLGRAGALVRLGDEEHAAIVEVIASWFRSAGFDTEAEGSFSEWGERGRIDLLAFDPSTGTFVIVEVKTQLLDLQDLFGSLNVKERRLTPAALDTTLRHMLTWVSHEQASRGTWIAGRQRVRRSMRAKAQAQVDRQGQFSSREPYPSASLPSDRVPVASSHVATSEHAAAWITLM